MVAGPFRGGREQMKDRTDQARADRRSFLKLASLGTVVGGASLALSPDKAEASVKQASEHGAGYRETDHVKTYYDSTRF